MNWVDLAVLGVLALSGLLAFMRGLAREVLGLGAWVAAAILASPYGVFPYVQPWVRKQFSDPATADLVAFGLVFVAALVALWLVAGALSSAVRGSALGGLDRTLGLVFGLARGAALVSVAYVLLGIALPAEQWPAPVRDAGLLRPAHRGAEWLATQLPAHYRPSVANPPPGRPTTSASLLQSSPSGRALGARPARD